MELVQYLLQGVGACLVCLGFVRGLFVSGEKSGARSYWDQIDTSKREKLLHSFTMWASSKAIQALVFISALLCVSGIIFALLFSNVSEGLISEVSESDGILNALLWCQIIFYSLFFLLAVGAIYGWFRSENKDIEIDIPNWVFIALGVLYLLSFCVVCFLFILARVPDIGLFVEHVIEGQQTNAFFSVFVGFSVVSLIVVFPLSTFIALSALALNLPLFRTLFPPSWDAEKASVAIMSKGITFVVGLTGSMFYTLGSAYIGTKFDSESQIIPFQLVLSNAVCDGLTLTITAGLLSWASAGWRFKRILEQVESFILENARDLVEFKVSQKALAESLGLPRSERRIQFRRFNQKETRDGVTLLDVLHKMEYLRDDAFIHILESYEAAADIRTHKLTDLLKKMSRVTGKSILELDHLIYRRVVKSDNYVSLVGGVTEGRSTYDPKTSWLAETLHKLAASVGPPETKSDSTGKTEFGDIAYTFAQSEVGRSNQFDVNVRSLRHMRRNTLQEAEKQKIIDWFATTWSSASNGFILARWRPIFAFFLDFLSAALLAYAAVYFGTLGTSLAMGFNELNSLFVGGFNEGHFQELGPMFWIMHTTFVPTLIVWLAILVIFLSSNLVTPLFNAIILTWSKGDDKTADKLRNNLTISKTGGLLTSLGLIIHLSRVAGDLFS